MPSNDVTLCARRTECPCAAICRWALIEPGERQSWFAPDPMGLECESLEPMEEEE